MMFFNVVFLGCAFFLTATNAERCERLASAFMDFMVHSYKPRLPPQEADAVDKVFHENTGVHLDDLEGLKGLACKVIGSASLKEVSYHLKISYNTLRDLYTTEAQSVLTEGLDFILTQWAIRKRLLYAAHEIGYGPHVGEFTWPLRITYQEAYQFMTDMVNDYGEDFLKYIGVQDRVNPTQFAKALTAMTRGEFENDFAMFSGLSEEGVNAITWASTLNSFYPGYDFDDQIRAGDCETRFWKIMNEQGLVFSDLKKYVGVNQWSKKK